MAKYKVTYSRVSIREMIVDSDLDLSGVTVVDLKSLLDSQDVSVTGFTEVDHNFKNDIIVQLIPDDEDNEVKP